MPPARAGVGKRPVFGNKNAPTDQGLVMTVNARVVFDRPQQEVVSLVRERLDKCSEVRIVSGFATVEGFEAIFPALRTAIQKLKCLVVGAGTFRAFELLDGLRSSGVPPDRLRVHLGHTRETGARAAHPFYRYHPMLHSKVYMMRMADGSASVFIGSHNLTGFAMYGLNGEAGVLLEGAADDPEMKATSDHINECIRQSVVYEPGLKEAYTWWTVQFLEGLRDKADDVPREGEGQRTIVILSVRADSPLPSKGDVVYFEVPEALAQFESLRAEVHIYVFPERPSSPLQGLRSLNEATHSYWCRILGVEKDQGGVELRADWQVVSDTDPRLVPVAGPFRPRARAGMRQIRARIYNEVRGKFEYLFPEPKPTWRPDLSIEEQVELPAAEAPKVVTLGLIPPEDKPWNLVQGLSRNENEEISRFKEAVRKASPETGGYILFSLRRKRPGDVQ